MGRAGHERGHALSATDLHGAMLETFHAAIGAHLGDLPFRNQCLLNLWEVEKKDSCIPAR